MSEKRKKPKSHRIQVVMDVLERFGRSDKSSICLRVANVLDEDKDSESFQRAIYRDLDDLVIEGKIKADYFHRDGSPILDFDSDVHKNYTIQWYIPSAEGAIPGGGTLENLNGLIYVPKILKNDFSIIEGQHSPDPKHRHFYFQIGSKFVCLKGTLDAIEFTIALSRIHGEITTKEIDEVQNVLGKRAIILKVPFAKLSAFKLNEKIANCAFRVFNDSEIEITDYNSKNGIIVYQLTSKEADEIREKGATLDEFTMTSTWKALQNSLVKPITVNGKHICKSPSLIEMGDNFKLLVI